MSPDQPPPDLQADPERLHRLVAGDSKKPARQNALYSKFIRWMRLALPLLALGITAVVFTWDNDRGQKFMPPEQESIIPKTAGKNELLNPRFENTDEQGRSYTLTARRAVQDEKDEKVVLLEKPMADMTMANGHWIAIQSHEGAFEQSQRKLLLRGDVILFHDGGYQLKTAELRLDMQNDEAVSETDVSAQGPEGTLDAKGLRGNNIDGTLVFTGPAKLVLYTDMFGKNSGGLF